MRKVNSKIYGDFYSPEHLLSYGRHFMISLGSRSIGKSTGWALFLLKNYERTRQQFMYIRRTDDELMLTCRSFFNTAAEILKDDPKSNIIDFKYDNRKYYIKFSDNPDNWEYCGYCLPLSLCDKYKSGLEGKFYFVIYDEFVSREGKYLGKKDNILCEWKSIYSLYGTLDRCKDNPFRNEVKMVFLGNNSSYYNPILLGLGITDYIRIDSKIIAPKNKEWVVECTSEVEATKSYQESILFKIGDEEDRNYNFKNINSDNKSFCEKVKDPVYPLFNITYCSSTYGVYWCESRGIIYICKYKNVLKTYALTPKDQDKINYTLVSKYSDSDDMRFLKKAFQQGNIIFENYEIKYNIMNYFMLTP